MVTSIEKQRRAALDLLGAKRIHVIKTKLLESFVLATAAINELIMKKIHTIFYCPFSLRFTTTSHWVSKVAISYIYGSKLYRRRENNSICAFCEGKVD